MMSNLKRYGLALLSAFTLWFAWCPMPYTSPLLLIAFTPLFLGIEDLIQHSKKNTGRKIYGLAFFCFFCWNLSSIYWVYHSIAAYNNPIVALSISLIPFTLAPLLMAGCVWFYHQFRKKFSFFYASLAFISIWISVEYLQQSWDLAFPWMNLGNGFAQFHQIIQWYSYTGIYGGSIWVLLVNLLIINQLISKKNKLNSVFIAMAALVPIAISCFLYFNYHEKYNPSEVLVVQPNIDPYSKNTGQITPLLQLNTLIRLSDSLAKPNTEYIIWPETALSGFINEDQILSNPLFEPLQKFLYRYKNVNLISGMEGYKIYSNAATKTATYNANDHSYYDSFNSALQLDNDQNTQVYHKSKLVPGVERLPFANALSFLKPVFSHFGGSIGGFGYQNEPSVFYAQSGIAAAPIICYESIWGNWVAGAVKKGAQFITIMTNDAWWGNSSGKDQHEQYAKLRAIENRRWVARAANTGISCFINAKGDVIQKSTWWTATALSQEINLNSTLTFYTIYGDYLVYLCLIVLVISLLIFLLKIKKN